MSRFVRSLAAMLAVSSVLGVASAASYAQSAPDFAAPGSAYNVLPPGQYGNFPPFPEYATDQLALYDALTPRFDQVTDADLPNYFKENVFGLGSSPLKRTETVPGHPDLKIERDRYEVPHITAPTRADVMFGIGYVTAEDRTLLMDILRNPGRIAAVDAPGLNAFALATSLQPFTTSQQTEDFLTAQTQVLEDAGPAGLQIITDIDNYLEGINTWRAQRGVSGRPWNRNDVVAVAAMIGAVFGKGGGDEARRSALLDALQDRLGKRKGRTVWNDLREQNDPEAPVSIDGWFRQHRNWSTSGNVVVDNGSIDTSAARTGATSQAAKQSASNAVLVGRKRSATGHPFFVAGPQVGYFFPGVLYEVDAHGGGIDARGATFPGSGPYVELGRGPDFSWSATSSGSDNIDIFVETLCGDDTHYRFKGECLEMTTFNAGSLGFQQDPVVFKETVHGPVIGYATVDGERVALSLKRSTRGREVASALGFAELNDGTVHDVESFFDTVNKIEFTFNWFYADEREIAMFSSGRLPIRDRRVDMGLPTNGNGNYEWRGFLSQDRHPHGRQPRDGTNTNWNNKPAKGWEAADDQWSYGPIQREQLLDDAIDRQWKHTLGSTVAAMNRAATQDLRNAKVLRSIKAVLQTGPAPTPRDQQMLDLLKAWRAAGSSRLDRDGDGKIDDPGAAIMDKAWPKIADAVMAPVLGPQLDQLASLQGRDNRANNQGSAYQGGWYGYVDKDLRRVAGRDVDGPFKTRFCGGSADTIGTGHGHGHRRGHGWDDDDRGRGKGKRKGWHKGRGHRDKHGRGLLTACRNSLWAAVHAAGDELAAEQGTPDPAAWRSDANPERIVFQPGFLPFTMRWTNRPTFQQAISYSGHR